MAVPLFHRTIGDSGPALVVLHGLLGSSRNWLTTARALEHELTVHLLDLRNHGDSPHGPLVDMDAVVADVLAWLDTHADGRVWLLGHSYGGKVAMRLACTHPDRLRGLAVLDMAPKAYRPVSPEVEALRAVDLTRVGRRRDADRQLAEHIDDRAVRQFLLTNLVRHDGGFRWRIDLELLAEAKQEIRAHPLAADHRYDGPTLFVAGGMSEFIDDADLPAIRHHFPATRFVRLADVGHNPHVEAREALVGELRQLISPHAPADR